MKKDLRYYLNLDYAIEIRKIKENEGGGFSASIPLLGKYAFVGDGETIEEAIENLNIVKETLFKKYLKEGIPIPEPQEEEEKTYSGKFLLRVPVELHRFLAIEAKRNGTTLNQYLLYLLTRKSFLKSIHEDLEDVKEEIKSAFSWMKRNYSLEIKEDVKTEFREKIYDYNKSA